MSFIRHFLISSLAIGISALSGSPETCFWDPPLIVMAGANVTTRIQNPWGERCQAILEFSNDEFLPITWSFEAIDCAGVEVAQFTVPFGVPNGTAFITWECKGGTLATCNRVIVTNGTANLDTTPLYPDGVVGCVLPQPTTTATTFLIHTNTAGKTWTPSGTSKLKTIIYATLSLTPADSILDRQHSPTASAMDSAVEATNRGTKLSSLAGTNALTLDSSLHTQLVGTGALIATSQTAWPTSLAQSNAGITLGASTGKGPSLITTTITTWFTSRVGE